MANVAYLLLTEYADEEKRAEIDGWLAGRPSTAVVLEDRIAALRALGAEVH